MKGACCLLAGTAPRSDDEDVMDLTGDTDASCSGLDDGSDGEQGSEAFDDDQGTDEPPSEGVDDGAMSSWQQEQWEAAISDAMALCVQEGVPAWITACSFAKLHVTLSDLPPAVRACFNWKSDSMTFSLAFGPDLLKHALQPVVSVVTPDGRHWLSQETMTDPRSGHRESGVYNLKPLLSLIALDFELLWPAYSELEVKNRVTLRVSASSEAAQVKEFQVADSLTKVDAQQAVADILRYTRDTIKASKSTLARLVMAIWHNLRHVSSRCFVCGACHPGCALVAQPQACTKALCRFNTVNSTRFAELLPALHQRPQVVDLLLVLAGAACESSRSSAIFTPAPVDFINDAKMPDFGRIADHLRRLPAVTALRECCSEGDLLRRLSGTYPWRYEDTLKNMSEQEADAELAEARLAVGDPLLGHRLYCLLWWVISNICDSIEYVEHSRVPADLQERLGKTSRPAGPSGYGVSATGEEGTTPATRLVFRIASLSTVLSRAYKAHADAYKTFEAYHGSAQQNWYSILKHGLRNMSGSTYQINGAAHGKGIYLGKQFATSLGYSQMHGRAAPAVVPPSLAYVQPPVLKLGATGPGARSDAETAVLQAMLDTAQRWQPTHVSHDCRIIGVCQVARTPQVKALPDNGFCWVIPDAEHVMLQYLVVENCVGPF